MKTYKKFSWFDFQGLPIAAATMVFLIVFMLAAGTLTHTFEGNYGEDANVQGVVIKRPYVQPNKIKRPTLTPSPSNASSQIDTLLKEIDALLKQKSVLDSTDVSDLK